METAIVERVISPDGTPIAYYRTGAGSPLILVAGTGAANPLAWSRVVPILAEYFTVIAVDRRGRGESGDGPTYAIEREFEDLAAVVGALGEPAFLLGHSFGALCALEAARLTHNLNKLILYEPLIPQPGEALYPSGFIDRLEELLVAGDRAGVLTTHYRENAGLADAEIEMLTSSPAWPARLATAHTLPRELRAEEHYRFEAQRFRELYTPTLLLLGGDSSQAFKETAEQVARTLPNSQIAVMPGQEHIAMYSAPDLFLKEISCFLMGGRISIKASLPINRQ